MSLPSYTKGELSAKVRRNHPIELTSKAIQICTNHIQLAGHRMAAGDVQTFISQLIQVLILENPAWMNDVQIDDELDQFFRAIRTGDVELKAASALAYADAHRLWKNGKNRSNLVSNEPAGVQHYHRLFKGDESDFSNPNAWSIDERGRWNEDFTQEIRRNVVDFLEGVERFYANERTHAIQSGEIERSYNKAKRIYSTIANREWTEFAWKYRNDAGMLNMRGAI